MKALFFTLFFSTMLFAQSGEKLVIDELLTKWHDAAYNSNEDIYFSLLSEDAVFMGTDATERWSKEQFIEWSKPYFAKDKAWHLYASQRNIFLSEDENIAWFDEVIVSEMGPARGSGVLVKTDGSWKIKHYNLSLTIPNELLPELKPMIEKTIKN